MDIGHRATTCHTWTEALRAFGRENIDLVLMDAVMPTVDGFKLTRILRNRASTYVPILFLTGLADQTSRAHGIEAGADDFLTKPIDPLELRVRMQAMLRIRSLTQDLEEKTRTLSRIASMDALTGVGNRRTFDERLATELRHARTNDDVVSVLLLDLDFFKDVNDTYGHQVGDELLRAFGQLLAESTRACDLPYRYGGEEFAIICVGTSASAACNLAERIRTAFGLRSRDATVCGARTVSIGVCGTDQIGTHATAKELLGCADAALYRAKESGRNCVCKYDTQNDVEAA